MRPAAPAILLAALAAATAGCIDRPGHGLCVLTGVEVWVGEDRTFEVPVSPELAAAHAEAWRSARVHVTLSAENGTSVRLAGEPRVEERNGTIVLAYALPETVGVLIPYFNGTGPHEWRVEGVVDSGDPALDGLPLLEGGARELAGTILVTDADGPDPVPGSPEFRLDGRLLPHEPRPRVPLPGGELIVDGGWSCYV